MAKKDEKEAQKNWSHKNDFPVEEVWCTYQSLSKIIAPRLRTFKEYDKHGYCQDFKGMAEWNQAIQKMIDAFELLTRSAHRSYTDEEEQTIEHGLDLLRKHYRYLWD